MLTKGIDIAIFFKDNLKYKTYDLIFSGTLQHIHHSQFCPTFFDIPQNEKKEKNNLEFGREKISREIFN